MDRNSSSSPQKTNTDELPPIFMNIKVFNISLNTTDSDLLKLFFRFGVVDYAKVHRNSLNGQSLKFGEVCMPVPAQARQAIASLDKTILDGKTISVSELPAKLS